MEKSHFLHSILAVHLIFGVIASYQVIAGTYQIIDLGTLGGEVSTAYGINDHSEVVGFSRKIPSIITSDSAYIYKNGVMTDLGMPGRSAAIDINNWGQIIISSNNNGFLYQNQSVQPIGSLGGPNTFVEAINDAGQIVGRSSTSSNVYHAFLYHDSVMQDLGAFSASDINNVGQIAGGDAFTAIIYENGQIRTLNGAEARAINDLGQAVGYGHNDTNGNHHAFLFDGSNAIDLGTLGGNTSEAYDINNSGKIVGWSRTPSGSNAAFLYENGVIKDLCILTDCIIAGWEKLHEAHAVNEQGEITGIGRIGGETRAFLAMPFDSDSDGANDAIDNCPSLSNPLQSDNDNDGIGNVCDPDDDNDGILDSEEDVNGNGIVDLGETNPLDFDSDDDGLTDGYEINISGTDPNSITTLNLNPGDMNGDGVVNLGDLLLLQRQILGL